MYIRDGILVMNAFLRLLLYQRRLILVAFSLIIIFTTGCESEFKSNANNQESITVIKPTTTLIDTPSETVDIKKVDLGKMDINNFKPVKECFIKYDFSVEQSGTEEETTSFIVQGRYDLNMDGSLDSITLFLRSHLGKERNIQAYMQVNGIKKEFYMDYSLDGEVRIIDLDSNDKFLEIIFSDEGPSGDPHYVFYRYDGLDLHEIGSIDNYALMNGQGRLLSSFQISRFKPAFYSAWYEIENNMLIQKVNNIERFIGKSYEFAGGEAYFIPSERMPEKLEVKWEEPRQFDAGEIKIINVYFYPEDRTLNYYFVELPNGEKGMLYFWIGD